LAGAADQKTKFVGSVRKDLVLLDARLILGDSSAYDLSSILVHDQERTGGVGLKRISSSTPRLSSPSPSPSPSPHPPVFSTQMRVEIEALIVVELNFSPPLSPLRIACPSLQLQNMAENIGIERKCMRMQLMPLIPAAASSIWHVTVLGVTGAT
jgi:hypothetical protein